MALNILVTGASKGIGLCLCNILTNNGYNVIGIYNNTLIDTDKFTKYKCDISREEEVKKLFEKVIKKYKRIDVLVNCAALSLDNDIFDKSKEEFMQVIEVNLEEYDGPFKESKYGLDGLTKKSNIDDALYLADIC